MRFIQRLNNSCYSVPGKNIIVPDNPITPDGPDDNNYAWIEIGGLRWATMNIGAVNETDTGLYFQWGDTQGYTAAQVGEDEGQKYFDSSDYKYSNNNGSVMTKYNSTDGKTVLDASDDAAQANWGGAWRMPTAEEYVALSNAVNTTWTDNYQGSGVAGMICTDKTDNSKELFFPASGLCFHGDSRDAGLFGYYWSSSLSSEDVFGSYFLGFFSSGTNWKVNNSRYFGYTVRGVMDIV